MINFEIAAYLILLVYYVLSGVWVFLCSMYSARHPNLFVSALNGVFWPLWFMWALAKVAPVVHVGTNQIDSKEK